MTLQELQELHGIEFDMRGLQEGLTLQEDLPAERSAHLGWHQHPNGAGWVQDTASVQDTVYVAPGARVYDRAHVFGGVRVCDQAQVYGDSWVFGSAEIHDHARVSGHAYISVKAKISAASKETWARPGVKARRGAVAKAANARPEVKAKINAYNARPEVKDRQNVAHKASWESPRHGWNKKTGRLDWGAGEYRKEQKKWRKRSKRRLLKFQENAI